MSRVVHLVLEDGTVFTGESFGAQREGWGEVVFNTTMTGYQEVLTDPSYAGQMVALTYPLVGNYGINRTDFESRRIQASALIVRQHCDLPSHSTSDMTLHAFLEEYNVPGISGIDTRALTRRLRTSGVMMGLLTFDDPDTLRNNSPRPCPLRQTCPGEQHVTTQGRTRGTLRNRWPTPHTAAATRGSHLGHRRWPQKDKLPAPLPDRCEWSRFPANDAQADVIALANAALWSCCCPRRAEAPTAGKNSGHVRTTDRLCPNHGQSAWVPACRRALGARTYKLKFGHRGGNHPVKDLESGRVHITAQNHGYAVDADNLPAGLEVSQINLNDNTVEGLRHRELPLFTIQYHSEASPGPKDNEYLFDRFLAMVDDAKPAGRSA